MTIKCNSCHKDVNYNSLEKLVNKECPFCKATLLTPKEYREFKIALGINKTTHSMVENKEQLKELHQKKDEIKNDKNKYF